MVDHKHGTMSIRAQEKTYQGFIKVMVRSTYVIIGILVFMAIVNA